MYIPEFWCGVVACILGEIAATVVAAVICAALKPNKNDKENKS